LRNEKKNVSIKSHNLINEKKLFLSTDENFAVPYNKRGMIGMANKGRHTNGSQFFITLQPSSWMNCKYVCFGFV
jgi:cyclophilin family peptidyl-prolyl cis-trans isomerase